MDVQCRSDAAIGTHMGMFRHPFLHGQQLRHGESDIGLVEAMSLVCADIDISHSRQHQECWNSVVLNDMTVILPREVLAASTVGNRQGTMGQGVFWYGESCGIGVPDIPVLVVTGLQRSSSVDAISGGIGLRLCCYYKN